MNRREALKATVGTLVTAVVGSDLAQASQIDEQKYNWEWRFIEEQLFTIPGWHLYLNGRQVSCILCKDFNKYDMATITAMKHAAEQEVFWRLEKQKLRDGSYPDWFFAKTRV